MKDEDATKEQLIKELDEIRQRLAELETCEAERRVAEEALRQSEEKLRLIFESLTDGIMISDLDGNIVQVNESVVHMHGYLSKREIIGQSVFELIAEEDRARAIKSLKKTLERGYIGTNEYTLLIKGGRKFPAEINASVLREGSGNPAGFIVITRDISEYKRVQWSESAKAKELKVLKEVNQLRAELLDNISHELRTPLASIKGFTSTLLLTDVKWSEEEQRDFLQTIDYETNRLTHLVINLLDMSRLDAGVVKLKKGNYHVLEIVDSVRSKLASLTEYHQLQVIVHSDLPNIFVDEVRIGQVLTNLVENAIKYSPEGSEITVEGKLGGDQIIISVTDRGEGIPAELLDKVFDRFYQTESIVTGRKSGTGLGLSICRGIVEAHGGRIWVESKLGEGSKFSFSLPVSKEEEEIAEGSGN